MHYLDVVVQKIENEIQDLIKLIAKQGSTEYYLRKLLVIGLDSWITWRTLRYLLRAVHIDDQTHPKWIQTPSSANYSQLNAIWHFSLLNNLDLYIESIHINQLGDNSSEAKKMNLAKISDFLVKKRQEYAHFSTKNSSNNTEVSIGIPSNDQQGESKKIIAYYELLRNILISIEHITFLHELHLKFNESYQFSLSYPYILISYEYTNIEKYSFEEFKNLDFSKYVGLTTICLAYELTTEKDIDAPHFCIEFNNIESGYGIRCSETHSYYKKILQNNPVDNYLIWVPLINPSTKYFYDIWGAKGYYRDIHSLLNQIDKKLVTKYITEVSERH